MATLKATLIVNGQGTVLEQAQPDCFFEQLKTNDVLTDHVHINDRIALLSFLADLREKKAAVPVSIRLNCPDRTRFVPVILKCHSTGDGCYYLTVEANSSDVDETIFNSVSAIARTAHEMRTPLNAIIGFADLLEYTDQQTEKKQKRLEYISMIRQAGQHLLSIVDNTLKNVPGFDADTRADNCSLFEVLKETVAMTAPLRGNRIIRMKKAVVPVIGKIDAVSFRQICFNILSNAIKYTSDSGSIDIKLSIPRKGYCQLTIEDDGIGMDSSHLSRLGSPFLRAPEVVAGKIDGAGLGLSLVFDLVKRAGGKILFDSKKGRGTRVRIFLQLIETPPFVFNRHQNIELYNEYLLKPEMQRRNNGKKTKDRQISNRKTA